MKIRFDKEKNGSQILKNENSKSTKIRLAPTAHSYSNNLDKSQGNDQFTFLTLSNHTMPKARIIKKYTNFTQSLTRLTAKNKFKLIVKKIIDKIKQEKYIKKREDPYYDYNPGFKIKILFIKKCLN